MEKTSFMSPIVCYPMNSPYFLRNRKVTPQDIVTNNPERIHEPELFSLSSWLTEQLGSFFSLTNKENFK